MAYFSILHILVLIAIFLLFMILCILSFRQYSGKMLTSMLFTITLVSLMLGLFAMLTLDKYTKKAKIVSFEHQRVLRSESIVFRGQVRNIGNFNIGSCKIEIKIINNPSPKDLSKNSMFQPRSGLGFLFDIFGKKDDKVTSVLTKKFKISGSLSPQQTQKFILTMPFPTHFKKPSIHQKLYCR